MLVGPILVLDHHFSFCICIYSECTVIKCSDNINILRTIFSLSSLLDIQMFLKHVQALTFLSYFDRFEDRVDYRFDITFEEEVVLLVDVKVCEDMEDPKLICSKPSILYDLPAGCSRASMRHALDDPEPGA